MRGYKKYKASEFFQLLEMGERLVEVDDLEYKMENGIIFYRMGSGFKWEKSKININTLVNREYKLKQTVKNQINEILKNEGLEVKDIGSNFIVVDNGENESEKIIFSTFDLENTAVSLQMIPQSRRETFFYTGTVLNQLSKIFTENNNSFKEENNETNGH